jgi:hypothetical protein
MIAIAATPFIIQGVAILWDELVFHRRRGLPKWEIIGHPIDTLLQLLCMLVPLFLSYKRIHLLIFAALSILSTFLITKDEKIHADLCCWQEHWLHSILFIIHPVVLMTTGLLWSMPDEHFWFFPILKIQLLLMTGFFIYQIFYWSIYVPRTRDQQQDLSRAR